jgi:uncharacterized protein
MTTNRRTFEIGHIDDSKRCVRVLASTRQPVNGWEKRGDEMVPRLESLKSWNLDRFRVNPVILWQHDPMTPIGTARDIEETTNGLEMTVFFDTSDEAERVFQLMRRDIVRGVSVGYELGERTDEDIDGQRVAVFTGNELLETSIVSVPADADAITKSATRSDAAGEVYRYDYVGTFGKLQRTQVGGIKVPARLTRTGVLEYRLPDGSVRRELRHPDEVFHPDSLATLSGATVTDLDHHRSLISTHNWRDATLGHIENVRSDSGKYISADVIINDARAVVEVENKRLHDISCGYSCRLDFTPGTYQGESYDAIQRQIRYNHVAVLPKGVGRAGTDVALRLDAKDAVSVEAIQPNEDDMKLIRIDGKDIEYGSESHIAHLENAHLKDLEKFDGERKELQSKLDAAEAARDAKTKEAEELEEKAKRSAEEDEEEEKSAASRTKARMKQRLKLVRKTLRLLDMDEEDEEKMDALDEKSDRDLMLDVIRADAAWTNFDGKDKSDDYVAALFDSVTKRFNRADGVDSVVEKVERAKRSDANDESDIVTKARKARDERMRNMWKRPEGASKS